MSWTQSIAICGLLVLPAWAQAQVGGNLAAGPLEELYLEVRTGPDNEPVLSVEEFQLTTGDYYRLNIDCPDVVDDRSGWRVEFPALL